MSAFWRLNLGQSVTILGNQLGMTTLTLWMSYFLKSFWGASLIQSVPPLASLLFFVVAGVAADRFVHRSILVICDVISAVMILLIACGVWLYFYNTALGWALIVCAYCGFQVAQVFFAPASEGMLRHLTKGHPRSQGIFRGSQQASSVLGQMLSGPLYILCGAFWLLVVNSLAILVTAVVERTLPITVSNGSGKRMSWLKEARQGLVTLIFNARLRALAIFIFFANTSIAPFILVLPFYFRDELSIDEVGFSFALASFTIGQIVGSFFLATRILTLRLRSPLGFLAMLLGVAILSMYFLSYFYFLVLGSMLLIGISIGCTGVIVASELHHLTEVAFLGRVMSAMGAFGQILMPLMSLTTAFLFEVQKMNYNYVFFVVGGLFVIVGLFLSPPCYRTN